MTGVSTVANEIIQHDEKLLNGQTAPAGSWMKTLMITNPELQKKILPKELGGNKETPEIDGLSINNKLNTCPVCMEEANKIKGDRFYAKDITNKECMKPVFHSLVKGAANGYELDVYSYPKFLEKSKNIMENNNMELKELFKNIGNGFIKQAESLEQEPEQEEQKEEEVESKEEPNLEKMVQEEVEKQLEKAEDPQPDPQEEPPEEFNAEDEIKALKEDYNKLDERVSAIEKALQPSEPESTKSKQPELNKSLDKIDNETKTETDEPELKKNHLNMPILSSKELQERRQNRFRL